jgi:hypothetical protein
VALLCNRNADKADALLLLLLLLLLLFGIFDIETIENRRACDEMHLLLAVTIIAKGLY